MKKMPKLTANIVKIFMKLIKFWKENLNNDIKTIPQLYGQLNLSRLPLPKILSTQHLDTPLYMVQKFKQVLINQKEKIIIFITVLTAVYHHRNIQVDY